MIRVQKGKFSGREIYDIVVAAVVVTTDAVLVTTRILFGIFYSLSPLPLRYQNSTLEARHGYKKKRQDEGRF